MTSKPYEPRGGFVTGLYFRTATQVGRVILGQKPGERDIVIRARLGWNYPSLIPPYVSPPNPSPLPNYEERESLRYRDERAEFMRKAKL